MEYIFTNRILNMNTLHNLCKLSIDKLTINKCNIGDKGIEILAEYIKTSTLKELTIRNDYITHKGTLALKNAIEINSSLIKLDLSGSLNGEYSSPNNILEGMKINKSITILILSYNTVYNSTYLILNDVLYSNTTLQELYLGDTLYDEVFFGIRLVWENGMLYNSTLKIFEFSPTVMLSQEYIDIIDTYKLNRSIVRINTKHR